MAAMVLPSLRTALLCSTARIAGWPVASRNPYQGEFYYCTAHDGDEVFSATSGLPRLVTAAAARRGSASGAA